MKKFLMERPLPADFDPTVDFQAAAHAKRAVGAMKTLGGRMHWLSTYATADSKLFGLVAAEDEDTVREFTKLAGIAEIVIIHPVIRVLDPATASIA